MLVNLHVKNFAIINEADVDFGEGLNILTGETGAGKSILIDSVNAALGSRTRGDVIGNAGDSAAVELLFSIENDMQREALRELDIDIDTDSVVISRKLTDTKSIHRINGETVTAAKIRAAAEVLIDIHGQHEHQSLTKRGRQLMILDRYAGVESQREAVGELVRQLHRKREEASQYTQNAAERARELDFLRFELDELRSADIKKGEKEDLTEIFRRYKNSAKLTELVARIMTELCDDRDSASEKLGRAVKAAHDAAAFDESLKDISESLETAEDLISSLYRDTADYFSSLQYDPDDYRLTADRLDEIHRMEQKYGGTYEALQDAIGKRVDRINILENYDELANKANEELSVLSEKIDAEAGKLSAMRRSAAPALSRAITEALKDLNFLDVRFDIRLEQLDEPSLTGMDEAEMVISVNPGEEMKPLSEVASGGELSRIMLGIKTVLADRSEIPTLIFDEIDTGISGRTAQMVSNKLAEISSESQVICITHLPQIAAMADVHFAIEKSAGDGRTVTRVTRLGNDEAVAELARLLGGESLTELVYDNAREMKALADKYKKNTGH